MESNKISKKTLSRLPVYLEYLKTLPEQQDQISATTIARALGLGDVQVRKDLAKICDTGRRRTGRSREQLIHDIENYLDFVTETRAVLVGTGKLGQALLEYGGFQESGLNLMAGFDVCPPTDRTKSCAKPIYPMSRLETFCKHYDVRIGVIAVPAESAQAVCDCLIDSGVRAIWNFAPVRLKVPDHVVVRSENLALSLTSLRLELKNRTTSE